MALTFTHLEETASLLKSLSVLAIFKVGGKPLPQKVARMECCRVGSASGLEIVESLGNVLPSFLLFSQRSV